MDPIIIAAIITVVGALIVAVLHHFTNSPVTKDNTSENFDMADIKGKWEASFEAIHDLIHIKTQDGRNISGVRRYRGTDRIEKNYVITGYFDGMLLSLAATCVEAKETRTLSLFLRRKTGTKFVGVRTHLSDDQIRCTKEYEWTRC